MSCTSMPSGSTVGRTGVIPALTSASPCSSTHGVGSISLSAGAVMVSSAPQSANSTCDLWLAEPPSTVRLRVTGRSSASRTISNTPTGTGRPSASITSDGARLVARMVRRPSESDTTSASSSSARVVANDRGSTANGVGPPPAASA
jgi:hypothetical protein